MRRSSLLRGIASSLIFAATLVGAFALVRSWDFTLPSIGAGTYQAVFLSNGQVFFGHYHDRIGPYVKIDDAYYIQQTSTSSDPNVAPDQRLVRRGDELHAPAPAMLVPKTTILFVEDLSSGSPIAQFMAKDER